MKFPKQMMVLTGRLSVLAIVPLCLAAGPVFAGTCSNPPGNEADRFYNGAYHTYQFCNGTGWVSIGGAQSPETSAVASEFGDTQIEPVADVNNNNNVQGNSVTLSRAGILQSLSVYILNCNNCNSSEQVVLGVYDATGTGGIPGNLLATTGTFAVTQVGWVTENVVTPVALSPGTYWLMGNNNDASIDYNQTSNGTGTTQYCGYTFGALPANFTTGCGGAGNISSASFQISAYGTVTLANGAACKNPAGNEGDIIYNSGSHVLQFCNGADWIAMGQGSGGGGGDCSSPAGKPADFIYNGDYHTYQFCNGTNWVKFGGHDVAGRERTGARRRPGIS